VTCVKFRVSLSHPVFGADTGITQSVTNFTS